MGEAARRWHLPEPFTGVTAYMFYVHENSGRIQAEKPTATFTQVSDLLEEGWDALTDELKERYADMERASEARHTRGMVKGGRASSELGVNDNDAATTISMVTAAETIKDCDDDDDDGSNVTVSDYPSPPRPDCVFKIRSVSCGRNLILRDGQVVLDWPDGHGSTLWLCVENRGWLGFRNIVSGKLLGYDISDKLTCAAKNQQEWESFTVRPVLSGGCVLMMTHWGSLRPIGAVVERDTTRLAKIGEAVDNGIIWEFLEVYGSLAVLRS